MRKPAIALILIASLFSIPFADPAFGGQYDGAKAAYERGDIATAFRIFRALSDRGDASGENGLGILYDVGKGMSQDDAEAMTWCRRPTEHVAQITSQPPQTEGMLKDASGIAGAKDNSVFLAPQKRGDLPPKALAPGVPFISWREAAQLKYEDSEITNPSVAATIGMALEYWGEDRKMFEQADYDLEAHGFKILGGNQDNQAWTVADIKRSLVRGVPVIVSLPLTPFGHPLYYTFEMFVVLGQVKDVELKDKGQPRSNALGRIVSLEDLRKIEEQIKTNPLRESVHMASRLVIGFDDDRKVFLVHEPSFGPVFEISYDDFDGMWAAVHRAYSTIVPADPSRMTRTDRSAANYRPRTPQEQAAMHFVYGYALDGVGRLDEARGHFEKGLSIQRIGKGYEFLLLFELALNRGERNDIAGAIEAAEKATTLLPEHPFPWDFLSKLYTIRTDKGSRMKAQEARKKAEALKGDQEAQKIVAAALPADFLILYLSGVRGWGGDANP